MWGPADLKRRVQKFRVVLLEVLGKSKEGSAMDWHGGEAPYPVLENDLHVRALLTPVAFA